MAERLLVERIVVSHEIAHGKPHVNDTREMIYQVLDLLVGGQEPGADQWGRLLPQLSSGRYVTFCQFCRSPFMEHLR